MKPWYQYLWSLLKWGVVGVGAITLLLIVWSKIWPHRITDTAFVSSGNQGCQFTFDIVQGNWMSDTVAGTQGFVPKGTKTKPAVFLNGVRFWSSTEVGGWYIPQSRKCTFENRGVITTKDGASATLYLASQCPAGGDWYPDHATQNLLYSYVPQGKEADIIWMASDDRAGLLKREAELKTIVKSYSTNHPDCVATRKTR